MGRLSGKRALVTAAGQGIGKATALAMEAEGATVFATDINPQTLTELQTASAGQIETYVLDVLDAASIQEGVNRAQPDILFNGAGFVHHGTIVDATEDEWNFALNLNVRSMMRTIQAALPGMLERGGGSIINMSSACSSVIGAPNRFIYGTTKAAVIGLTKSVAFDYIKQGIRCNAICPGTVESPSLHDRLRATGDEVQAMKDFVARQRMGRMGTAEASAALAGYPGSDASAFTTATTQVIDGGWSN